MPRPPLISRSRYQLPDCMTWLHAHVLRPTHMCRSFKRYIFDEGMSSATASGGNKPALPHSATSNRSPYWYCVNSLYGFQLNEKTEMKENHIKQQILFLHSEFRSWGGVCFLFVFGRTLPLEDCFLHSNRACHCGVGGLSIKLCSGSHRRGVP